MIIYNAHARKILVDIIRYTNHRKYEVQSQIGCLKGVDFLENEELFRLYQELIEAQASIDTVGMEICVLERRANKAKRGRDDYANNIGKIIPSFLFNHKRIYKEAESRYENAREEGRKAFDLFESLRQKLQQYALDHCVPSQYRNTATAEYLLLSDFITITYYVDEGLKELVTLRLYISDSKL